MIYYELLLKYYNVLPNDVKEVKGGWSAKAYRVDARKTAYFLKVYDKAKPSIQPWIKRIDSYIHVLGWLSKTPELQGQIVEPIPSVNGSYKVETDDNVFLLFAYVHGNTVGEKGLSCSQVVELAGIFARLHSFGENIPCDTSKLHEDISLSFCDKLKCYLDEIHDQDVLYRLMLPEVDMIRLAILETVKLRNTVRLNVKSLVLCHTDAHYNNVIQSDRLVLVDWEDLRLAPAEADLFMYALNPHWKAFWNAYSTIRSDFHINADLMRFYLIKRRLEDIWYYLLRVLLDKPNEDEVFRICGRLRSAFSETQQLLFDEHSLDFGTDGKI